MILEYLVPEVRQAGDFAYAAARIEPVEAGIALGLEEAGEVLEPGLRMDAAAIGRNLYQTSAGSVAFDARSSTT